MRRLILLSCPTVNIKMPVSLAQKLETENVPTCFRAQIANKHVISCLFFLLGWKERNSAILSGDQHPASYLAKLFVRVHMEI